MTRILKPRPIKARRNSGFTLIELLLVLGIIAAVLMATGRRIYKTKTTPATIVRKFGTLSRQLALKAKLTGSVYRLVIAMETPGGDSKQHAFWVERSNSQKPVLLDLIDPDDQSLADRKEAERMKKGDKDDKDKVKPAAFALAADIMKKPIVLPENLRFKQVESEGYSEEVVHGRAHIHFFPQGLIEQNVIQLENESGLEWSLMIHPLTGKTDLVKEHIKLKDLMGYKIK